MNGLDYDLSRIIDLRKPNLGISSSVHIIDLTYF